MARTRNTKPFRSARTEVKAMTKTGVNNVQQLAFLDPDFLLREELRPIRVMLELLKPETILREERVESTIVIFGSARINEYSAAKLELAKAKRQLKARPKSLDLMEKVKIAENLLLKSHYYDEARKFAKIVSNACQQNKRRHFVIVTGGGPGIMEGANRGAADSKAKSVGFNIILPFEQNPNRFISSELCFEFHYFAMRKMHFLIRARALIAFPGGYGTFDELFEALTLLQTGKIKPMPILLFGKEYWSKIINFENLVLEGMISREDLTLFQFVEKAEEAWQIIVDFYQLSEEALAHTESSTS